MSILTDTEVMTDHADYWDYFVPALENILGIDLTKIQIGIRYKAAIPMDDVLGVNLADAYNKRLTTSDKPMPQEWRDFLQKLAGPYGHTILKVYQAKKGIKCHTE